MTIKKELKNVIFEYHFDKNKLYLFLPKMDSDEHAWVEVSRVEMFSLARFILRIAQKGIIRKIRMKGV